MCRRGALLLQLLDSYATRYSEMLDGRSEYMPVSELAGGARIRHIFQDIFSKGLDELNPSRWTHLRRCSHTSFQITSSSCSMALARASPCICAVWSCISSGQPAFGASVVS